MPTGNYAVQYQPASDPGYAPAALPGCGANDPANDVGYRVTADTRVAGWNVAPFTVVRAPQDNPAYGCTGCAPGCKMDIATFSVDRTSAGAAAPPNLTDATPLKAGTSGGGAFTYHMVRTRTRTRTSG